jgi:hypothetical protein
MKLLIGAGGLTLCATLMCAALGAEGTDAPQGTTRWPCDACLDVCQAPLSYDDSLLDESTDSYTPAAARVIATGAAVDMAAKLKGISRECRAGHFGRVYEANARAIESLAKRESRDRPTSAEIDSLKRVRTALYADTVVALQAQATGPQPEKLAAAYAARAAVLDGVLRSMSARQQMRTSERLAVCEVLSAYKDE